MPDTGSTRRAVARLAFVAMLLSGGCRAVPAIASDRATAPVARPTAIAVPAVTYRAADAWASGAVSRSAGPGNADTGYLTGFTTAGAEAVFVVGAPRDGVYAVSLRYANGAVASKPLAIYANGLRSTEIVLTPTGSSSHWSTVVVAVALRTGINTVAYVFERGSKAAVSLDGISIAGGSALAARGATVPYQEYEAEDAKSNGTVIGPSRVFGDLAAEASGRKAVTLDRFGQYVEFSLNRAANGMTLRYSVPDSKDGKGITARLGLYVDGHAQHPLVVTSKYTWLYGNYPFTNNPQGLGGHHFYDEVRVLFPSLLPSGTTVRVQVDPGDTAPAYTVDMADFEQVPAPYAMPGGYLSATDFGADKTGIADSTRALQRAVDAAEKQQRGLYIPAGTYRVTGHILLNRVTLRGAGPWYTVLKGPGVGLYGDYVSNTNQTYPANADGSRLASTHVQVYDLMIEGETADRMDNQQVNGFGGSIGGGSIIQNVWIEHTKVGMWFDGPFSDLLVVGDRMRDLTADGINLHDGISNVTVEQCQVRNTGDDGLALWSDVDPDSFDVFRHDTVQIPYLANNVAMYGGHQNSVLDNYLTDTLTQGGGINIGNRDYGSAVVPLSGRIDVSGNLLVRTGQVDPNWGYGVGAIWFYAQTHDIDADTVVSDDEIDDSTQEAIQFTGNEMISNITFDHLLVQRSATFVFQVQSDVSKVRMSHVVAVDTGVAGVYDCGNVFSVAGSAGNVGWSKTMCADLQELANKSTAGSSNG